MAGVHPSIASSHVFHRSLRQNVVEVVSGSGVEFTLKDGRSLIDASGGPAVAVLGHRQNTVADAAAKQMSQISYVYSGSTHKNEAVEELASILLRDKPGGLSKAIFVNSGSEATDAALKLASQYWVEVGQPQRVNIISRFQSYHGNTLGALSVSGNETRRAYYKPWLSQNVHFVDPCYAFRGKLPDEDDCCYVNRLRHQLEQKILELGPETVSAFVAETVSGSSLGCVPPVPGYLKAVREVCDKYDILLILDEIMCGMGKTGTMHAWEQDDIRGPDIQMIGKALGAGFVPLSAVLTTDRLFDAIANGSGMLTHGHTFQGHPVACAAAAEVQKIIKKENLLDNVRRMGELLQEVLTRELENVPFVADVRGRGLFRSVEFLRDPQTKTPFAPGDKFSDKVVAAAASEGLNIIGNFGVTGQIFVDHVILAPPYIIKEEEVVELVGRLKAAIVEVGKDFS
ncbi:pyridoxal phosphate-dependent transferase [Xylariomycetidae sp. FL2044]|nr:pyridoxal phosphate-dependent transferase [Xylariomycetidae sp. FL2044]